MRLLIAPTEAYIKTERGKLNADAAAGSSVALTLVSNEGLAVNDYIAIGYEGTELAELQKISAVTGDAQVTVGTLKFAHKTGDPIVLYRFNQRKFYGSLTKDGTYTELTSDGSPKDIQVDDPQGTLLEYTTGEGFLFFKATYFNSTATTETAEADAEAVEADESKRYCSIFAIRKQAGLVINPFITDGIIETFRKRAESEINSSLFSRYTLPLSEIPPIIENACALLAGGYIDYQEFGKDGEGVKWLGEARGLLKAIKDGRQRLLDSDYAELTTNTNTEKVSGWPDDSTADDDATKDRKFKAGDQF